MNEFIPTEFYLGQNYPNPFREKTTIKYCIAYKTRVQLTVFDKEGNQIEKMVDEVKEAGTYKVEFYAGPLPYGIYYTCMNAGKFSEKKLMEILR